jgi:hypothetical protein
MGTPELWMGRIHRSPGAGEAGIYDWNVTSMNVTAATVNNLYKKGVRPTLGTEGFADT